MMFGSIILKNEGANRPENTGKEPGMKWSELVLKGVIIGILSFQLSGCGTILYPERRGQKAGQLDVGIVLFDALGLFVGIIPGVIAFAVDFSTGAIYLPDKEARGLTEDNLRVVKFDPKNSTPEMIEKLISEETGKDFHFNDEDLKIVRAHDQDEIPESYARLQSATE